MYVRRLFVFGIAAATLVASGVDPAGSRSSSGSVEETEESIDTLRCRQVVDARFAQVGRSENATDAGEICHMDVVEARDWLAARGLRLPPEVQAWDRASVDYVFGQWLTAHDPGLGARHVLRSGLASYDETLEALEVAASTDSKDDYGTEIEYLGEARGLSAKAAAAAVQTQDLLGYVRVALVRHGDESVAEVWLDRDGVSVHAAVVGKLDNASVQILAAAGLDPTVVTVPATREELLEILESSLAELRAIDLTPGGWVEVHTGTAQVTVAEADVELARRTLARVELPPDVKLVVSPSPGDVDTHLQLGGVGWMGGCTGGLPWMFNQYADAAVSSAGHCNDGTRSSMGHLLPYIQFTQIEALHWDIQLHESTHGTQNAVEWGSGTRAVTAVRTHAMHGLNDIICHEGITTGLSCGDVITTTYTPQSPGTWSPTFIRVGGYPPEFAYRIANSDSGGPNMFGNQAAGIQKGKSANGTNLGPGHYMTPDWAESPTYGYVQSK